MPSALSLVWRFCVVNCNRESGRKPIISTKVPDCQPFWHGDWPESCLYEAREIFSRSIAGVWGIGSQWAFSYIATMEIAFWRLIWIDVVCCGGSTRDVGIRIWSTLLGVCGPDAMKSSEILTILAKWVYWYVRLFILESARMENLLNAIVARCLP